MTTAVKTLDLRTPDERRPAAVWRIAPWVLRVAEWKDLPVPVLVAKERHSSGPNKDSSQTALPLNGS
jgi:hypothetical protein